MLPLLIIFALLHTFILYCCIAVGDDPASRAISDREQMEYIRQWQEQKKTRQPKPPRS